MYVPLIMAKVAFRVISGHDGANPISILRCFVFIQTSAGKNANKHGQPDQYLGSMQVDEDGSRFASYDSCQHVKARHANRRIQRTERKHMDNCPPYREKP